MKIIIDELTARKRSDVVVADNFTQYSRAALKKLFEMGNILLNEELAKPGDKMKIGQVLTVDISPLEQEPDVIELPVIYEDENVIVVDKPAGIISHARGRYWQEASVASFIRDKTKDMEGERAGIVHRLDRATSGVMIAAKNTPTQVFLQKQFADKKVVKDYVAIVTGTPETEEAHIIVALARNPKLPQQFKVTKDGKHSETIYKIAKSQKGISKILLHPLTGRTHQLRIHMQYMGHPILGDILYGHADGEARLYLHAHTLKITLPDGRERTFEAPIPEEFEKRFNRG